MEAILNRAGDLKQDLIDFVFEAEGEVAVALETYAAAHPGSEPSDRMQARNLLIDSFLSEGQVGDKTPIDLFLESQPDLPESDRRLLESWRHSFIGLFEVIEILPDGFDLLNWLSAKHYIVKPNSTETLEAMARLKQGEILLTRIVPVTDTSWMFSGSYIAMGKLGKPKLAVAIGNFKKNYKSALYSDAPELLEQAWESVEQYHQDFLDFFGSDEITLPGYQLNKKFAELQEVLTRKRLAATGIDESRSLQELVREAGVDEAEIEAAVKEAGADSKAIGQLFDKNQMVMPKVELPDNLKKAEQVTVFSHPRWGQMFLPTYTQFKAILEAEDGQSIPNAPKVVRNYLEDPAINVFIWQRVAQQYPTQLEKVLQTVLVRSDFSLERDLEALLQEFNKPLQPELPEIASVPVHLHNLFQEALSEVNKSKSKPKAKKTEAKGFRRS